MSGARAAGHCQVTRNQEGTQHKLQSKIKQVEVERSLQSSAITTVRARCISLLSSWYVIGGDEGRRRDSSGKERRSHVLCYEYHTENNPLGNTNRVYPTAAMMSSPCNTDVLVFFGLRSILTWQGVHLNYRVQHRCFFSHRLRSYRRVRDEHFLCVMEPIL